MLIFRSFGVATALLLSTALAAQDRTPERPWPHAPIHGGAEAPGTDLSIDELYRYKSLIGTSPEGYSWAPDGDSVLFLWNDEGYSFRDLWSYSVRTGKKTRLTSLGRDSKPEAEQKGIGEAIALGKGRAAFTLAGQLHIREADGRVTQIETDKRAVRKLALSPDGKRLAFVSGLPVDARNRVTLGGLLWVRDLSAREGEAARRVVGSDDPKIYVESFEWAKDGRTIAFQQADDRAMPERDIFYYTRDGLQNNRVIRAFPGDETTRATVGVVDVATGQQRLYERPDAKHHIWGYGLSSDGKRLFVSGSDMEAKEHTIYVYDVTSGARETFYQLHEPRHLRPDWQVAWAPGDDGLIILTDRDGWLHLYHQRRAGDTPRQITDGRWEIASFDVDAKRGQLYFTANKSHLADRQLYRVPFAGGAVEQISGRAAGTHEPVYSPDFRHIADWYSNDATPPELYLIDTAKPAATKKVTASPQPAFYRQTWANIGYAEFPSHVDGTNLVARISLPANYDPAKRYPVIVGSVYSDAVRNQWGGRRAHPTWGIDQYFVAQGYIVLNVNIRGSWGQGRDHNQSQYLSYGETDINDLESGVRFLIEKGYADPKRIGIWGSSYGGLMTIMSLAKKPGVYAAGIAGAPATNVWHAYPAQMWIMGPHDGPDMPARYEAQSALYQAKGIRDPLMVIHGTRDPVVLYSDTVALADTMIEREQMFELVTLPGGNHAWASDTLPQARFAFKKMVDFFDRHVKGAK
ncbi:MAG: prolyl oligopeptidase family serine peptidase [Sphingopyxis sp.]|uniref:S9 family peptidase n=1 Tax=Sphingopyxis sp. TaxID=1908224 RepID=UPI002ABA4F61|nr:prolyl oligopeptidase family serine peptidase [Sphingopyxis sp.]MDZ3831640.1 prolyl oligopeptidase family serine peptidase [Sphingopyxis sp.]